MNVCEKTSVALALVDILLIRKQSLSCQSALTDSYEMNRDYQLPISYYAIRQIHILGRDSRTFINNGQCKHSNKGIRTFCHGLIFIVYYLSPFKFLTAPAVVYK